MVRIFQHIKKIKKIKKKNLKAVDMRGTVYLSLGGFTSYDLESGKGLSTG
jgi:hypothetical protein